MTACDFAFGKLTLGLAPLGVLQVLGWEWQYIQKRVGNIYVCCAKIKKQLRSLSFFDK